MNKQGTEIAALGEFGLIDRLTARLKRRNSSTLIAAGDDAAVIDLGEEVMLLTTDMMTEGIDFDLSYFPLQHLGYKAIVRGVNDILAMNGKPEQVVVALGISAKITVEALDALYEGMERAAEELKVDIVGGDTTASMNGLTIAISATGRAEFVPLDNAQTAEARAKNRRIEIILSPKMDELLEAMSNNAE